MRRALRQECGEWSEIPPEIGQGVRFIDSHVHVSEYRDLAGVLRAARASKILLLSSGVDRESPMSTLRLAKEHPDVVKPFIGVHPSEAGKENDLGWLAGAMARAEGAGEVGLDPKYAEASPIMAQMAAFREQLTVAERLGKPIQVHTRGAERECLDVLSTFRLKAVLLHWFQGKGELTVAMNSGYYLSFGPSLLYSAKLQRMAKRCNYGQVLAETDGPVPFAALGGANGPTLIPSVVFAISEIWGMTFQNCGETILENGRTYLGTRTKG